MSLFNEDEIKIVWYLSTIGNEKSYRKVNKVNLVNVSIPKIVEQIDDSINLRLSSNLMYGLSVLYKLKTNFFYNDLTFLKTQFITSPFKVSTDLTDHKVKALNNFLKDDKSFVIEDLVPRFHPDDIELGRRGFQNDIHGFQEFPFQINLPGYENINDDYDMELNLTNRSTMFSEPMLDNFDLDFDLNLDLDLNSSSSGIKNLQKINELPVATKVDVNSNKRKFKLIIDEELRLSTSEFDDFKNNYEIIMEIQRLKKQFKGKHPFDRDIEIGRKLVEEIRYDMESEEGIFDYEQSVDDDARFELSFPELDLSGVRTNSLSRSTSRSNSIYGPISGIDQTIEESNRFFNYLKNFQSSLLKFSEVCPPRCTKTLVCKSFMSVLELSTNNSIHLNVDESNETELMESHNIRIMF
ncbi:hypothetical protein CLIB1444_18S00760 [[Candida] jaroonii]|uniref:Uncharacterized protein n=1 Tax=[Candida] jaroonii TaxID=467808 RepID=A0ACA9YF08_9ASCO|nr:hypothetical protein CLIB1444_18S00760 [[Candida] jaroonii]